MFTRMRSGLVMAALGFGILFITSPGESDVVPGKSKGKTIKRFTGLLSGPGTPGTVPKGNYVNFICDPRSLNWEIRIVQNGKGRTQFIGDVRFCDHVEIMMEYYSPAKSFPDVPIEVDGTAIWIRRIP